MATKSDTKFKKGNPGKLPGTQNKFTRTVKETVLATFHVLQKDRKHNLTQFAKDHPRDFYAIAAKLIPTEITGSVKTVIKVIRTDD